MFTEIRFRDFREQYPGFLPGVLLIIAVLVAIDLLLVERQKNYASEIEALRATMSESQRQRGDALADSRGAQERVKLELVRREGMYGKALHLSVDVDSAQLSLMQEGATLRRFPVKLGVSRSVQRGDTSTTGMPRGPFVVQRVLGPADPWPVPRWVYTDRRLAVPADSMVAGALGPVAILLEGGAVIYSQPTAGPLKDSAYVLPGAVRANAEDLRAIVPNLTPGTPVYVY
jgi:hypothetical protein